MLCEISLASVYTDVKISVSVLATDTLCKNLESVRTLTTILGVIRMSKINVQPLVKAFDATEKADGTFKSKVLDQYAGCKTAADYIARRKAVNSAIDKAVKDTDKAKRIRNKVNTVLNRDILNPNGIKLVARKGGRKAAPKATPKAAAATAKGGKAAATTATIQAATPSDFLSVVSAWVAGKGKAELTSMRSRIDGLFASAIANSK